MNDASPRAATVLVLGASRYQLEVIEAAKRLGMRVVTTDNVPENPGHRLADEAHHVDTTDVEAVIALARDVRVDGVIAPCTDVAVTTAARVGAALGLPHVPAPSTEILTSKVRFRRWLAEARLPSPAFDVIERGSEATLPRVTRPRVVKPEGSSGSKGIFVVASDAELVGRLPETFAFSRSGLAIVEDVVPGRQGSCEGVILGGELALAVVTDRETAPLPYVATAGHRVPSAFSPEERLAILGAVEFVLDAHGIDDSPFDCDFVFGDDGDVYLLEVTPRLGGNSMTRLVRAAVGVDLAEVAVRLACGAHVGSFEALGERPVAQLVLGVGRAGRLTYDEDELVALRAEPWVRDLSLDVPAGSVVEAFVNGRTRVGEATVVADSRPDLDARVAELRIRLALDAR